MFNYFDGSISTTPNKKEKEEEEVEVEEGKTVVIYSRVYIYILHGGINGAFQGLSGIRVVVLQHVLAVPVLCRRFKIAHQIPQPKPVCPHRP